MVNGVGMAFTAQGYQQLIGILENLTINMVLRSVLRFLMKANGKI